MISILGAVFLLLVSAALVFRREWLPWILSAAVPFSATAGLTVAGQSIVMYQVVAIVVVAVALRRHQLAGLLAADITGKPGLRPLLAFGAWALAVTLLAPIAFSGLAVLDPREGIDDGVKAPSALAPSLSNFAQGGYLIIAIATVVAIGSMSSISPRLPTAAFAVGTVLSSVRGLLPAPAQNLLFDNSANVSYTTGEFDGVERMRGIFSEPSALGAFSVAAAVFFLLSASTADGWTRLCFLILGAWALVTAVLSFSGSAVVSGLIVLVTVLIQRISAYLRGRLSLSAAGLVSAIVLALVVLLSAPMVSAFVEAIFTDKTGSSSYENRNAADAFSYALTGDSLGLGVGIGSNRPSSFFASMLSTSGLVGTALFACAVVVLAWGAARRPQYGPVVAALVSVFISKLVAGPDVSEPIMWFLLAICAAASWGRRGDPGPATVLLSDTQEGGPSWSSSRVVTSERAR